MARLVLEDPNRPSRNWPLRPGINGIGRAPDNSVRLNFSNVSRHHAELLVLPTAPGARVILKDLGSSNGTFVNGEQVQLAELASGDHVHFGGLPCQFENERADPDRGDGASPACGTNSERSVIRLRDELTADRMRAKLDILLEIGRRLSGQYELDVLLQGALALLFEHIAIDRATILLRTNNGSLEPKALRVRDGLSPDAGFYSRQIAEAALTCDEPQLSVDAGLDSRFDGSHSIIAQSIHASLCVPLTGRDGPLGVLYVDNIRLSGAYSQEDADLLRAIGGQVGLALDNAALIEKVREETAHRGKLERFFPPAVARRLRDVDTLAVIETQVTALFCDISDYTELCSRLSPVEVIRMLNAWFDIMVEQIIFPLGGTLEKYIGDALLAVWGAPYSSDQDADLAVQAAVQMQQAVQHFNADWRRNAQRPINIHIGINTGPAAAGNIGSHRLLQYATVGDTTNLASRICAAAGPGEVLMSNETRACIPRDQWPLDTLPPTTIKGKDRPIVLYRLDWSRVTLPLVQSKQGTARE